MANTGGKSGFETTIEAMRLRGHSECVTALAQYDQRIGPSQTGISNVCLAALFDTEIRMRAADVSAGDIAAYAGSFREEIRRRQSTARGSGPFVIGTLA